MNTIYLTTLLQSTPSLVIPVMIAILTGFALAGVILINRIILRRIRRTSQMTSDKNAIMQQALKISSSNVVYYDISKRYVTQLYGHMMPDEGLTAEEWTQHVHQMMWKWLFIISERLSLARRNHWSSITAGTLNIMAENPVGDICTTSVWVSTCQASSAR